MTKLFERGDIVEARNGIPTIILVTSSTGDGPESFSGVIIGGQHPQGRYSHSSDWSRASFRKIHKKLVLENGPRWRKGDVFEYADERYVANTDDTGTEWLTFNGGRVFFEEAKPLGINLYDLEPKS